MRLHRDRVVDAAIGLLDADGLDAMTMRKLADRLDVRAGALYYHFASKQALLDAMADRFLEGLTDELPAGSWDERVSVLASRLRQALLAHRDGARVMAGTFVAEPNTVKAGNTVIEILKSAGLSQDRAAWATLAVMYYVLGHAIEEQAQREMQAQGSWEPTLIVGGLENRIASAADADPGERFDYGLRLILDGVRQQSASPADNTATPKTTTGRRKRSR